MLTGSGAPAPLHLALGAALALLLPLSCLGAVPLASLHQRPHCCQLGHGRLLGAGVAAVAAGNLASDRGVGSELWSGARWRG